MIDIKQKSVILSKVARGFMRATQSKDLDTARLATTACTILATTLLFLLLTAAAQAQGCAQCLEATRATPPAVQAAYRHAIYLLATAAATFFTAGILLLRRHR